MERTFLEQYLSDDAVIDAILQEHGRTVSGVRFQHTLAQAVSAQGGRNLTAIRALLDENALLSADAAAVQAAVRQVKRENPYLFDSPRQPYAAGSPGAMPRSVSLEELGDMDMEAYRRYRKGN